MVSRSDSRFDGLARQLRSWRLWIVVVALALIGTTSASAVWHGQHGTDQECVVCQLRHHTVADLTGAPQTRPADTPERISVTAFAEGIAHHPRSSIPTRAPPA